MTTEEAISTDHFLSLSGEGHSLYKDRGSKFIGFAAPVASVEEAMDKIGEMKSRYHDARHHCFAYRVNPEKPEFRANDDGEPNNSAGMPIYNQLQSFELWNAVVVVVRYFGGTKLGVPGLINAYKEAAREAIEDAKVSEEFLMKTLQIRFPYSLMNEVMRLIKDEDAEMLEGQMAQDAGYRLAVRKNLYEPFLQKLRQFHKITIT